MEQIYVKIYEVILSPPNELIYYVKLKWHDKKYKTGTRCSVLIYNDEFLLPLPKNTNDNDLLLVELWTSGCHNRRVAYTTISFDDMKKKVFVNKEINLLASLFSYKIRMSAYLQTAVSNDTYVKMVNMFPNVTGAQIKAAIEQYKTEDEIIIQLSYIESLNNNNSNYVVNNANLPPHNMVSSSQQHFTGNPSNQQFHTNVPEPNKYNPVILNNAGMPVMPNTSTAPLPVNNYNYPMGSSPAPFPANNYNYPMGSSPAPFPANNSNYPMGSSTAPFPVNNSTYPLSTPTPYGDVYLYRSPENKKKALLVGINYYGTKHELRGCVNDTARIKHLLITKYGFCDSPLTMIRLIDNDIDPNYRPTKKNILSAMAWLTRDNKRGDVFFFLFSGHGSQQRDYKNIEADGYNETILPCDHKEAGEIIDDDIQRYLVQPLHNGVKLIALMDCCQSGTSLDLAYEYKLKSKKWKEIKNPFHVVCDVSQFSSCRDKELSCEVNNNVNAPGGSLVNAFIYVLTGVNAALTYEYLLNNLHTLIYNYNKKQTVTFMSSQKFSISHRFFDFDNILENKNTNVGQILNYVRRSKR